ncbi:MAG: hypothetical protein LPK01_16750 [Hymenobacteraceae bacterium]|nr:hypothetical protein [Hymenobacteraceae bacterium]
MLDATDPNRPYFLLSSDDISNVGLVLRKNETVWVPLSTYQNSKQVISANLTLLPEGSLSGKIDVVDDGYYGLEKRQFLLKEGEEKYSKIFNATNLPGFQIQNLLVNNLKEIGSPLKSNFEISSREYVSTQSSEFYVAPMLFFAKENNPFKVDVRNYPINFSYPKEEMFILNLTIPAGYEVVETPKPVNVQMPDQSAQFIYMMQIQGNNVQLISKFKLLKSDFMPNEYEHLKQFYALMIGKQAEKMVVRKKQ